MDKKKITETEWLKRGKELFGEDMKKWKWVCPSCGGIQGYYDFKKTGMDDDEIRGVVYFSCVGRYNGNMDNDAFVSGNTPCNYTTGGLLNISPLIVVSENGNEHSVFDFAPQEATNGKEAINDSGV